MSETLVIRLFSNFVIHQKPDFVIIAIESILLSNQIKNLLLRSPDHALRI
jgi:hypothetical protein